MKTKNTVIIAITVLLSCILLTSIGMWYFYTHSFVYTTKIEPAYMFTKLIKPESMKKIENEEFVYKKGFFKAKFTIIESDIDIRKHWAPATREQKLTIADYTTVYSMKEWIHTAYQSLNYWCFLYYYTGTFYLEAYIECNNPKNETELSNAIDAFITHMNARLS